MTDGARLRRGEDGSPGSGDAAAAPLAGTAEGPEYGARLRHLHPVPAATPEPVAAVTVAVVSPYPTVRAGLRVLLEADPHLDVVAEGATVAGLADAAPSAPPAVLVLDPAGADVSTLALAAAGASGVVLLGAPPDSATALSALGERAWAYLPPDADGAELAAAVLAVHAGLLAIHPSLAARLLNPGRLPARALDDDGDATVEELTPRELEVLTLLAEGIPNKAIARRLGISDHTVKFHVGALLGKLSAGSRTEAVRIGVRRGLIAL